MYDIGRLVALGKTTLGIPAIMYRLASKSYPHRQIVDDNGCYRVVLKRGCESDDNPYVSDYTPLMIVGDIAVTGNGEHVDKIGKGVKEGGDPEKVVIGVLNEFGYEKDGQGTPRIVAVMNLEGSFALLATVRCDGLEHQKVHLSAGHAIYLATRFPRDEISESHISFFNAKNPEDAARYVLSGGIFVKFEFPLASIAAMRNGNGFEVGIVNL